MSAGSKMAARLAMLHEPKNPSCMFIFSGHHITQLYMPPSFCKYLDEPSEYIKVVVADGRERLIQTVWRDAGCMDLSAGWTQFAMETSVKEGDIGLFELITLKNMVLKASIFRATFCGSVLKTKMHQKSAAPAETSDYGSIFDRRSQRFKTEGNIIPTTVINDVIESAERKSKRNGETRNNRADGCEFSAKDEDVLFDTSQRIHLSIKTSKNSKKALQAARMSKPSTPSFLAILSPTHLHKNLVYVPANFARKYLSGASELLSVQSSDGEKWLPRIRWREHGGINFFMPGTSFFEDNGLKAGEI